MVNTTIKQTKKQFQNCCFLFILLHKINNNKVTVNCIYPKMVLMKTINCSTKKQVLSQLCWLKKKKSYGSQNIATHKSGIAAIILTGRKRVICYLWIVQHFKCKKRQRHWNKAVFNYSSGYCGKTHMDYVRIIHDPKTK